MASNNVTSFVAWWGALVATLVFFWDIYKWVKLGPKVAVSARPNMKTFGGLLSLGEKEYVVVEAVNKGSKTTTVTHLIGCHYPSLIRRLRKKQSTAFFVPDTGLAHPLPHVLPPGERWMGIIEQTKELEEMARNGYLYCGVNHSLKTKPVLQRVRIEKST
jgi:hypothetical protein